MSGSPLMPDNHQATGTHSSSNTENRWIWWMFNGCTCISSIGENPELIHMCDNHFISTLSMLPWCLSNDFKFSNQKEINTVNSLLCFSIGAYINLSRHHQGNYYPSDSGLYTLGIVWEGQEYNCIWATRKWTHLLCETVGMVNVNTVIIVMIMFLSPL